MSLILEPVAIRMEGMEMNATDGLISVIEKLNEELRLKKVTPQENPEWELSIHQEQSDQRSSHQEESCPQKDDATQPQDISNQRSPPPTPAPHEMLNSCN